MHLLDTRAQQYMITSNIKRNLEVLPYTIERDPVICASNKDRMNINPFHLNNVNECNRRPVNFWYNARLTFASL